MKVLIADDEKKICQLIQSLVDWDLLNLEVIGVVHKGLDALKMIEEKQPDIVITDIRMPDYGGIDIIKHVKAKSPQIDFIIISGYREFEYARNALKYGAEDYLLKPIKKVELNGALQRIIEKREKQLENAEQKKHLETHVKKNEKRIREVFVRELVENELPVEALTKENIEAEFQCEFLEPDFVSFALKIDVENNSMAFEEMKKFLKKKVSLLVENSLKKNDFCYCYGVVKNIFYVVVNYKKEKYETLKHQLRHIIYEVQQLSAYKICIHATIGVGSHVQLPAHLIDSISKAQDALSDRVLKGTNLVLEYQIQDTSLNSKYFINYAVQKSILRHIEGFSFNEIELELEEIQDRIKVTPRITGQICIDVCNEVFEIILLGIKSQFSKMELDAWKLKYQRNLYDCYTMDGIFACLNQSLKQVFEHYYEKKNLIGKKPIREAENYIRMHYQEPLTLEYVSGIVGFNPSYFSRVFKQETGKSFVEYITEVRMQRAQKLLLEHKKTILEIAEEVGYADDKYFSRIFKKHSGLKPNEYRKLYC